MSYKPVSIDHVNIFVRNAEQSHRWYTDILGLHTQDTMYFKDTGKVRAVFLSCDPGHAHDIALFEVGEEASGPQKKQVGLNHVAWRMGCLDDLKEVYQRLKDKGVPVNVSDHTVSIGVYFSDPDGNGLEVYYELPKSEWRRERPLWLMTHPDNAASQRVAEKAGCTREGVLRSYFAAHGERHDCVMYSLLPGELPDR